MNIILKKILAFVVDDVLRLKCYVSPIDKTTKLRRNKFLKEQKYLQDFDFMIDIIEDCICVSPDEATEFERKKALDSDYLYFELTDKLKTYGMESLSKEEINFLENYKATNDIQLN